MCKANSDPKNYVEIDLLKAYTITMAKIQAFDDGTGQLNMMTKLKINSSRDGINFHYHAVGLL